MSPLLFRMVDNYSDKSKKNKAGFTKVAYCQYCEIQHKNKQRIIDHKKKCKARLQAKKNRKEATKIENSMVFLKQQQTINIIQHLHSR